MICPACRNSFFTSEDALKHIVRQFFQPDEYHTDIHTDIKEYIEAPSPRWNKIFCSTTAITIPANNQKNISINQNAGHCIMSVKSEPITFQNAGEWHLKLKHPRPDLTTEQWLKILFLYIIKKIDDSCPVPTALVTSAICDWPDLLNTVQPKLEEIEQAHVLQVFTEIAEAIA